MDPENHEEIAHSLFRESNDALILFDPKDHRVVDVNPAALRLTGFDRKAICALRVWDLFSSDDPRDLDRLIEAYQHTGFFHSREGYALASTRKDPIPVNVSVSRIHTKPEPLGLAIARDVSEPRRTQAVLERFFRLSPALFAIVRMSGTERSFVKLNAAWQTALGHRPERLLGTSPKELFHPDEQALNDEASARLERGEISGYEHRVRHADGTYRWISWNAAAVDGLIYAVGRDTTEERRAKALRVGKDVAEAASRAKSDFLALVSHEMRTPLTSILGFTEILLDDPYIVGAPQQRLEDLRTLRRSGEHLLALIEDMLDLNLIESGRLRIQRQPCDVARIAEELVQLLRATAEAKGLGLKLSFPGPVPDTVETDPVRVRQVVLNLLGNAIKYTAQGEVRLEVGMQHSPSGAGTLLLRVSDTGPGLSDDALTRVFQPFFRAEPGPSEGVVGTGLGLAISRRLAELLGGRLEAESAPGRGSAFSFVLPVDSGTPSDAAQAQIKSVDVAPHTQAVPARIGGRVLVAEDNAPNRRVIAAHLKKAGMEVVAAENGEAAIELVLRATQEGRPFDVILMDMHMPVLDGYEATRRLRSEGVPTPIVALTAHAMPHDRDKSLESGCNDHISKPFDWDTLSRAIVRYTAHPSGN
jgi:PAS domain S-box-containing protein